MPTFNKKHVPDPITDHKRKRQFKPIDGKHLPREEIIQHIDMSHPGTNLRLMPRIMRAPEKVRSMAKRQGLSRRKIVQKQEQLVSRITSKWVDHLISGLKEKGNISVNISREEERKLWVQFYTSFIDMFFLKQEAHWVDDGLGRIKRGLSEYGVTYSGEKPLKVLDRQQITNPRVKATRELIVHEMDRTITFSLPPKVIIERRKDRGLKYESKAWNLLRRGVSPEKNLITEVKRILKRKYTKHGTMLEKDVIQAKAFQICMAASIYADLMERKYAENWTSAYADGMMKIQPLLEKRKNIERAIIHLDKIEIPD